MDTYRHKGLREQLISELLSKGISSQATLNSIASVPRHLFLDKAFEEQAYEDKALSIASGQTISQPYTVAFQTQLLDPQPTDLILEVGTGSGYQAAVLSGLCQKLYTIERHRSLYEHTATLLNRLGYVSIRTLHGDGYKGAPRFAPFDKIMVTAGARQVPVALLTQLKVGGQLVIPSGMGEDKQMLRILKKGEDDYETDSFGIFRFVPFLEGKV